MQSEITLLHVQRATKPMIEDVIPEYIDGDMKTLALDFIAYLRENKLRPVWTIHNGWKAIYKGKPIYYIRLGKDWAKGGDAKWVVTPYLNHIEEYAAEITGKGWQNLVWDNLRYCTVCNNGCAPGQDRTVLGREFKGLCNGILYSGRFPVSFVEPDADMIGNIKQLLDLEKHAREHAAKEKK